MAFCKRALRHGQVRAISPECKIVAETELFASVFTDGLNGKGSSKADTNYQLD